MQLKFRFSTRITIFDQNFDLRPEFLSSTRISIFDQNNDLRPEFRFSTKISIFFFGFTTRIWIFDQNFNFSPKCRFSTKASIFDQTFDLWSNFRLLKFEVILIDANFAKFEKKTIFTSFKKEFTKHAFEDCSDTIFIVRHHGFENTSWPKRSGLKFFYYRFLTLQPCAPPKLFFQTSNS